MGRIPGPLQHIAVVYPFPEEVPLGRLTERPGDEGHKINMPSRHREGKGKLEMDKPDSSRCIGACATTSLLECSAPDLPAGAEPSKESEANTAGKCPFFGSLVFPGVQNCDNINKLC